MQPTLEGGQRLSIREMPGDQVQRGDIVLMTMDAWGDAGLTVTRRVVGLGGDTVACCDEHNRITVNGKAIIEPYIKPDEDTKFAFQKYTATVAPGHVWVLGDNRGNARDSRVEDFPPGKGAIPVADIKGVVVRAGGDDIAVTKAFTQAGLPGEPHRDASRAKMGLAVIAGGVLFVVGVVWLLLAIRKRTT